MAWIALLSSCLLTIHKTNQFFISIAGLWKNKTWLYYSHGCYTAKFSNFSLVCRRFFSPPPPTPFYVSIYFFASHECFSVQFNFRGVLRETHKWIFFMGLTTECYGREFCNAKIFGKNTALTKHIFKIPLKHTQLLHDYCTIRHVTYNNYLQGHPRVIVLTLKYLFIVSKKLQKQSYKAFRNNTNKNCR